MLKKAIKYYFENTRCTEEVSLIITAECGSYYHCSYYCERGTHVRDSKFQKNGTFARNLQSVSSTTRDFYVLWVEGCEKPVKRKYAGLEEAKEACRYLIDKKNVEEVFIMKKIGLATAPKRIEFSIDCDSEER